uniref:Uncharacterized protein n=1 Tax=Rhizophagus irregularis (strain DAOM 181602 / DAOM 197198 / MUCL 43194) TaxID=747089 RepID=U9TB82_RHIID
MWAVLCTVFLAVQLSLTLLKSLIKFLLKALISPSLTIHTLLNRMYVYVYFSSATTKESAIGITCALKDIGFTWHELNEVFSLCHYCG